MSDAFKEWEESRGEEGYKFVKTHPVRAGKSALDTSKRAAIIAQEGATVLAAVKSAILLTPKLPQSVKDFINDGKYGDIAVGFALNMLTPVLTLSPRVAKVARSANIVATMNLSSQFTILQDIIEGTFTGISQSIEAAVMGKSAAKDAGEPTSEDNALED